MLSKVTGFMTGSYCIQRHVNCSTMHNVRKTFIWRVSFQLECGKKYGINFRIIAPAAMETKLMESFLQSCSVPADEVETTCPAEDRPLVGYVYITTFWKVLMCWKVHFVQFSGSQFFPTVSINTKPELTEVMSWHWTGTQRTSNVLTLYARNRT